MVSEKEQAETLLAVINNLLDRKKGDPYKITDPYAGLVAARKKPKRKASAYSKRYGAAYRKLKKQHPRMSFGSLSKKAHKEARR